MKGKEILSEIWKSAKEIWFMLLIIAVFGWVIGGALSMVLGKVGMYIGAGISFSLLLVMIIGLIRQIILEQK